MKTSLLFLAPLLAFQFNNESKKVEPDKTFYYFCVSGSKYSSTVKGVIVILYTDISKITCEEKELMNQAAKWRTLAEKNCENANGCSSDLNCYTSEEAARVQLEKMKEYCKDETRFRLKKLSLE